MGSGVEYQSSGYLFRHVFFLRVCRSHRVRMSLLPGQERPKNGRETERRGEN